MGYFLLCVMDFKTIHQLAYLLWTWIFIMSTEPCHLFQWGHHQQVSCEMCIHSSSWHVKDSEHSQLTHWGQDKMTAILEMIISNAFSRMKMYKLRLKGPINNIPALVQIMPWRWPGNKPLSEPILVSLMTHIFSSFGLHELTLKGS